MGHTKFVCGQCTIAVGVIACPLTHTSCAMVKVKENMKPVKGDSHTSYYQSTGNGPKELCKTDTRITDCAVNLDYSDESTAKIY